ncbi:HAD family hydrolase [Adhaeribacter soli]|uniref:HAD family phosphatase n=1 Tax=Adhaeribacter soli TaxID=2607655 RepID=A0A5N1IQ42_9BACT|nr:HAD family phosphatase [Adhaeribacter soli]KAA9325961.1 HAD family phosphatase [Adhaeribacter soli]
MQQLLIFDMDGVLLDSEPLYRNMNQVLFRELGAEITEEEYEAFIGISATKMWQYIKEKCGLPQTVEELKALEKERKHQTLLQTNLAPTAGIVAFLDHLKQTGHTLALASSSLQKNIGLILSKLDIAHYFDLIVSGEQVANGKPEPDIFLKAAAHYNQPPANCIVIEDSRNGVQAAKAAGMFCIGYYNPNSGNQDLSQADLIIDNFADERLLQIFGLTGKKIPEPTCNR